MTDNTQSGSDINVTRKDTPTEVERYHPSYCDKYEVLRGIYPNNRRLTGKDCSCGFEQAILDWHNKKIEEVLDRLEAQFVEEMVVIFGETEFKRQVPLSAIEAERNLKTGKKILLPGQKERN